MSLKEHFSILAKIICLVENESEIEKVANHCGKSPSVPHSQSFDGRKVFVSL